MSRTNYWLSAMKDHSTLESDADISGCSGQGSFHQTHRSLSVIFVSLSTMLTYDLRPSNKEAWILDVILALVRVVLIKLYLH